MKQYCLIFLSFFLVSCFSFAQNERFQSHSNEALVYELPVAFAKKIFQKSSLTKDDLNQISKLNPLPNSTISKTKPGFYASVYASQESLNANVWQINSFLITIKETDHSLHIKVLDSLNRIIEAVEITLDGQKINWDKKAKAYLLPKKKNEGFITINLGEETAFYRLDFDRNGYRIGFGNRMMRIVRYPLSIPRRIKWKFHKWFSPKPGGGYLAFSQPIFRPGDSLKVSSYITNAKGRPYKKDLQLEIWDYQQSKKLISQTVSPSKNGIYTAAYLLSDTFELDKNYNVFFKKKHKNPWRGKKLMHGAFRYEEYTLDEVEYKISLEQESYQYGDSINIDLSAFFTNGMPVPDGTCKIFALARPKNNASTTLSYTPVVVVKDTLWWTETAIPPSGKINLVLPPDSIPNAAINLTFFAQFLNSNGESQYLNKSTSLSPTKDDKKYKIKVEGHQIIASCMQNGQSINEKIKLISFFENRAAKTQTITLPYQQDITGYETKVSLQDEEGDILSSYDFDYNTDVDIKAFHNDDSVFIAISNSKGIPVDCELWYGKKLLYSFQSKELRELKTFSVKGKNPLRLNYNYTWVGKENHRTENVVFWKNKLAIAIDQPASIKPGSLVQIKIKATDAKGKPAKNVSLSTGGINAQFETRDNISLKNTYAVKGKKKPKRKFKHSIEKARSVSRNFNLDKTWYDLLDLNQSLYYRMRFSDEAIFSEEIKIDKDAFYSDKAQLAPYVFSKRKTKTIQYILVNRQLVYYRGETIRSPYSFYGLEGNNQITIRTNDELIILDSIPLKNGSKMEVAVNLDILQLTPSKKYRVQKKPNYLDQSEVDLLNRQLLILLHQEIGNTNYLVQGEKNIKIIDQNQYRNEIIVGPFLPEEKINYIVQNRFQNKFIFEPGFKYSISKNRERLYEQKAVHYKTTTKNPPYQFLPGEMAWTPNEIIPEVKDNRLNFNTQNPALGRGKANLIIESESHKFTNLIGLVLYHIETGYLYRSASYYNSFSNIPEGLYRFVLVNDKLEYSVLELSLTKNATTILNLRNWKKAFTEGPFPDWLNLSNSGSLSKAETPNLDPNKLPKTFKSDYGFKGIITDEDGEPLIGVPISASQNGIIITGTTTDVNGQYLLPLPLGVYDLEISYIGFETKKISNIRPTELAFHFPSDFSLAESNMKLEEVVVVGYGAKESKMLTVRGSRENATNYYADGVRTGEADIQQSLQKLSGVVAGVGSGGPSMIQMEDGTFVERPELDYSIQLRTQFKDASFWAPDLRTDENGEAYVQVTFPDNITGWETFAVGMDKKQRSGIGWRPLQAKKALVASLSTPKFLIQGDEVNLIGKAINYTKDSLAIETTFSAKGLIQKTEKSILKQAKVEQLNYTAPQSLDSISLSYTLTTGDYGDGEKRDIPIYPKGITQTDGKLFILDGDTTVTFTPTLDGPIGLYASSDPLDFLKEDLDFLKSYPYGCNEQNASRLMALLWSKKLSKYLNEPFKDERKIRLVIARLQKGQLRTGAFGWWPNSEENIYMSTYVLRALAMAKKEGYRVPGLESGLVFLNQRLPSLKGQSLLESLELLAEIGQNLDYESYITQLDSTWKEPSQHTLFTLLKIKQLRELPHDLKIVLDSKIETNLGSTYWKGNTRGWRFNNTQNTLLAYDILARGKQKEILPSILRYFLQNRRSYSGWGNTIETAAILNILMPEYLDKGKFKEGKLVIKSSEGETMIATFPIKTAFEKAVPLTIEKTGSEPIYLATYQKTWNAEPEEKSDLYSVTGTLYENGKKIEAVSFGKKVVFEVIIDAKNASEYVHIDIPIPAGCDYATKQRGYQYGEQYRSYFKNKVSVFCGKLPEGKSKFLVELEPRYTGTFTLNPILVEEMYYPVLYGRNKTKEIKIIR